MNIQKFTQKSIEAINDSEKIVSEYGNPQLDCEHFLLALLNQEGSLIAKLITKMGIDELDFTNAVIEQIQKKPKVSGGQRNVSVALNDVLLYAEDEKSLARAVSAILTKSNYSVDVVHDGEAALDYLATENYDGVILDVMMPKLDGIEVLRRMRAAGDRTPVLLLTAKLMNYLREQPTNLLPMQSQLRCYLNKFIWHILIVNLIF